MISDIPNLICSKQYPYSPPSPQQPVLSQVPSLLRDNCSCPGPEVKLCGVILGSCPLLTPSSNPLANLVSSTRKNASRILALGTPSASDLHSSLRTVFLLLLLSSHAANPLPRSVLPLAARRSFLKRKSDHVILPLNILLNITQILITAYKALTCSGPWLLP